MGLKKGWPKTYSYVPKASPKRPQSLHFQELSTGLDKGFAIFIYLVCSVVSTTNKLAYRQRFFFIFDSSIT